MRKVVVYQVSDDSDFMVGIKHQRKEFYWIEDPVNRCVIDKPLCVSEFNSILNDLGVAALAEEDSLRYETFADAVKKARFIARFFKDFN